MEPLKLKFVNVVFEVINGENRRIVEVKAGVSNPYDPIKTRQVAREILESRLRGFRLKTGDRVN